MTPRAELGPARWIAYCAVVTIQLTALWFGERRVSVPAQSLLMPVLALGALMARSHWLRTWTLIALLFSFLGDTVPRLVPESLELVALLASFLAGHIAWIIGLWRVRPPRPWLLVIYLAVAVAVVAWTVPGAGFLAPGVVLYAAALLTTAVLASGLGWPGVLGGALFIASDSLIAAQNFTAFTFPHHDVAVMATYAVSHGLLVHGVTRSPGHREGFAYSPTLGWHQPD
ncbi:lysoplasmalogenase family protein [Granulicoccus sp. GXG6511]|uniref:lysoplasmalogenase family protein n=1 Tax=Granulicoccus sp. GXG6511 TaxID=3381351 RepID=UPI003D7C9275